MFLGFPREIVNGLDPRHSLKVRCGFEHAARLAWSESLFCNPPNPL